MKSVINLIKNQVTYYKQKSKQAPKPVSKVNEGKINTSPGAVNLRTTPVHRSLADDIVRTLKMDKLIARHDVRVEVSDIAERIDEYRVYVTIRKPITGADVFVSSVILNRGMRNDYAGSWQYGSNLRSSRDHLGELNNHKLQAFLASVILQFHKKQENE